MIERRFIKEIDWLLILIAVSLAAIGITAIYSATYAQPYLFHQKQSSWLIVGLLAMTAAIIVNYSDIERIGYVIFALSIITLIAAIIFGRTVGGAQRWLSIGPITFQPSEFVKISFIIALAKYLSSLRIPPKGLGFKHLIIPFVIFLIPFILVAKQPDLGTALIFLFILSSMMLSVRIRVRTLIILFIAFLSIIPFLWHFLKGYQKTRLLSFIYPSMDPLGSGYHVLQSKIAIGSGGLLGKGFKEGTQGSLMFLPEHHTDFIFPVFAEEWGFLGSLIVMALFLTLIMRGVDIAANSKDRFGFLVALGVISLIFWQTAINAAMVMGLLPVVGVPMPFISYGGSAVVTMFIGIGLLVNIHMRRFIF